MSPHRLSHCTIIVVEDHDDARIYLGMFLSTLGANVILAKDGVEGLEAVKNNDPHFGHHRPADAAHRWFRAIKRDSRPEC
jgi:CheY-like chemotaxis protein